ncbi:hypothetical protein VZO05_11950 [Aggregatilineales bacterium SYSU G02658]
MAARTRKAPVSTRKFGLLRFIAYLYVIIGLLVLIGAILASVITLNAANNPIVAGGQVIQTGGATAAVGIIVSGVIVALIYVGIGHAILAFLSIEEHTRRSAIAQEQLLRANMQLLRQLDQRLP